MAEWWYFRNTHAITIDEQRNIADEFVPDKRQWLGAEPHASFKYSRDITALVYSDAEARFNMPSADRPIRKGDTVYVSHLFVLAGDVPTIQRVLQKFHHSGITLCITSLGYRDDGKRQDFSILNGALTQVSNGRKRINKPNIGDKKRKPGRPSRGVHYWTLTSKGKAVVRDYAATPVNSDQARLRLTGKTPDGGPVGEKMFQRLVKEYRSSRNKNQSKS